MLEVKENPLQGMERNLSSDSVEVLALKARYDEFVAKSPSMRKRQLAAALGVSEMELVAANCVAGDVILLQGPAQQIFKELGRLGRVMALTRNDYCVHERHGVYEKIKAGGQSGIVLGPDIDLRLFFANWATTFAIQEKGRCSLQFFDREGTALHKVYLTNDSDNAAFRALVQEFYAKPASMPVVEPNEPVSKPANSTVSPSFRTEWLAMEDTHEFHGLLRRQGIARTDALIGAGSDLAQKLPHNDYAEQVINDVAQQQIPFMCFVGNPGIIQIHSGPISKVKRTGPWFNVLEPHFNLHLDTTAIASTWVVNKPSRDGWVTSLECFSKEGEMIVQFFGARKPGVPELESWRKLLVSYCKEPLAS